MRVISGATAPPPPDDQERFIALLVTEAQSQKAIQAGTADGYDTKALGLLAVLVAGVAALLASRPGPVWFVATLLLAAATVPLFLTLWLQDFAAGPALAEVYVQNIGLPMALGAAQLLSEVMAALEYNDRMLARKEVLLTRGFAAVLIAAVVSAVLLSVVR